MQNANFSKVLSGLEEANLDGKYILQGLINLHVHLAGSGKLKKKQSDPVKLVKLITSNALMRSFGRKLVAGFAKTQLMSGVTMIRTVGGIDDIDTSIRDEINSGKRIYPRIQTMTGYPNTQLQGCPLKITSFGLNPGNRYKYCYKRNRSREI